MIGRAAALAAVSALAIAFAAAPARAQFAQFRSNPPPRTMSYPPATSAPPASAGIPRAPPRSDPPQTDSQQPSSDGSNGTRGDPLQPATVQSSVSCAPGVPCSKQNSLILPARSSSTLVQQQGAIPANASSTTGFNGPGVTPNFAPPAQSQLGPIRRPLPPGQIRITVRAISAGRDAPVLEIDGRLAPIDRDLLSIVDKFSYRTWRLLDAQTFDLDFRSIAQMELPGRRAVEIEPRQFGPNGRVQVHLEMLGRHPDHAPSMSTDYSIGRGATIFIAGFKSDDAPDGGTLFVAVTQDE